MEKPPTAAGFVPAVPALFNMSPNNFIAFFPKPTTSTTGPFTSGATSFYSGHPQNINWTASLDTRVFKTAQPGWNRVPKPATNLPGRRRKTVMKTAAHKHHQKYHRSTTSRPVDKHYTDKENETSESRRVRTSEALVQCPVAWSPNVWATESARVFLESKAQIVRHIAIHPDSVFDYTGRDPYLGGLAPIIREKRRVDSTRAPGANLAFYRDLLATVVGFWETHGLNTEKTDLVEHMLSLEGTRRDPRGYLAAMGAPDLTDITDATEPDSTHVLVKPTTPWTSAARRKARLSGYAFAGAKDRTQLAEVQTPNKTMSSPTKRQENISAQPSDYAPNGPTKVFKVPSYAGSETGDDTMDVPFSPAPASSPAKRDNTSTPSRWTQHGASTPVKGATTQPATPMSGNSLGLVAAIPAATTPPQPTPPWKTWQKASPKTVTFQFSDSSFEQTQASDHYSVFGNKANRRKSEPPLLLHLLKDQQRRFSASPQKFFAGSDRFDEKDTAAPATPVRPQRNSLGHVETTQTSINSDPFTPMPSYLKRMSGRPEKANKTPARDGVYSIDMRQNLDIFGSTAPRDEAPDEATASKVQELANIAEEKCGGHAKIVVTQENGKLIVRFKLPTKYSSMFPESQGFDESRFSVTPSAISSSPRINFKAVKALDEDDDPATTVHDIVDDPMSICEPSKEDEAPLETPLERSEKESSSELSSLDHTPTISGFEEINVDAKTTNVMHSPQKNTPATPSHEKSPKKSVAFAQPSPERSTRARSASPIKQISLPAPSPARSTRSRTPSPRKTAQHHLIESSPPRNTRSRSSSPTKESPIKKFAQLPSNDDQTLIVADFNEPTINYDTTVMASVVDSPNIVGENSSLLETPTQQLEREAQEAPSSSLISDISFEPAFQTPTFNIDFSPSRVDLATPTANRQAAAKAPTAPPLKASTPSRQTPESTSKVIAQSTPLNTSFTPVNKPASTPKSATPKAKEQSSPKPTEPSQDETEASAAEQITSKPHEAYDDSPGRDYMYAFIRRSKPKKPTATESGSPRSTPAARQPLGSKSPNAGSPSPAKSSPGTKKRKLEAENREQGSPLKHTEEPAAKKPKRVVQPAKKGEATTKKTKATEVTKTVEKAEDKPKAGEVEAANDEEPRRSTRIRNQPTEPVSQAPKSSIPTPIKLNRAGTGRGGQGLTPIRTEQAELSRQTSLNTKRNRFNADSVQQVLARCSEELSGEEAEDGSPKSKPSKRGNNVGWRDPLESFQQTPKPKKTKAAPKPKATLGNMGITKPKATPKTAAKAPPKSGISQAAKNLGMASNGTPAKRVTRARTRGQA